MMKKNGYQQLLSMICAAAVTFAPFSTMAQQVPELVPRPIDETGEVKIPELGGMVSMTEERALGDYISTLIKQDKQFYVGDPVLHDYVNGIWQSLLQAALKNGTLKPTLYQQMAWEMYLINEPTVNAFALPGAYIGVNLGLISLVRNKDELASVLAHESVHVLQRHIMRGLEQSKEATLLSIGSVLLGLLVVAANPNAGGAIISAGSAAGVQKQINFTRQMEYEADRLGYKLLVDAGFRPEGMAEMFSLLMQKSSVDMSNLAYLSTHPLTNERIAEAQVRLGLDVYKRNAQDDPLQEMMGARATVLAQLQNAGALSKLVAAAYDDKGKQLRANASVRALYAAAFAALQRNEKEEAESIWRALDAQARSDAKAYPVALMLGAEIALQNADVALAQERLSLIPAMSTSVFERSFKLAQAQVDVAAGRPTKAIQVLQPWLIDHPNDIEGWLMIREAYRANGQTQLSLRAEAESHMARRSYDLAIEVWRTIIRDAKALRATEYDLEIARSRLKVAEAAEKERHKKW